MNVRWFWSGLMAIVVALGLVGQAAACTGITLIAADGSVVRGRTLEFAEPLDSDVILIPRGIAFTGTTPDGKVAGLKWTAKYAAAGANGVHLPVIIDGLNEKGLGGGLFYFPGFAGYQDVAADEMDRSLAPWEILTWVLTSFATVDEVRAALPDVKVGNATLGAWNMVPPVHMVVTDATGKSIAVEYVGGELHIYDNPLGVFTNAPGFDWHMTNLRNYINISPNPQQPISIANVNLDPLSTGGNLFGLPGDFSSPSRFVRATVFSHLLPRQQTGEEAVMQGFHILDQFDIPKGSVPEPKGSNPPFEVTEWTTMSDLKALKFSIWTEDNRAIRTLDLTKVDLDGSQIQTFELDQSQQFVDLATG
jgi:choloylglycine hydrolase